MGDQGWWLRGKSLRRQNVGSSHYERGAPYYSEKIFNNESSAPYSLC
jgi:hypothetical protein